MVIEKNKERERGGKMMDYRVEYRWMDEIKSNDINFGYDISEKKKLELSKHETERHFNSSLESITVI